MAAPVPTHPATPAAPSASSRLQSLDGVRGLAGAAIALVHHLGQKRSLGARRANVLAGSGALVVLLSVLPAHHDSDFERFIVRSGSDATRAVLAGLGAALVITALVLAEDSVAIARVLRWRPLLWLGAVSYSLYLIHLLTITMALDVLPHHRSTAGLLGVAAALVAAGAMRRWVEVPAQRWGKRLLAGRMRVATLAP